MTILQDIRIQIVSLKSQMKTPCSVYVNLKGAAELLQDIHTIPYRQNTKIKHPRIYGLDIIVHDDFPEPVVRCGGHIR